MGEIVLEIPLAEQYTILYTRSMQSEEEPAGASALTQLSPGVFFSLSDSEHPHLNLVLASGKSATTSADALQWHSEAVAVTSGKSLWQQFGAWNVRGCSLVTLTNEGAGPAYAGLARSLKGSVYRLQFDDRREGAYWVMRSAFLLAESSVVVERKLLPLLRALNASLGYMHLVQDAYCCTAKKGGSLFIQGGRDVIRKDLGRDESVRVNACALLAAESTCVLESAPYAPWYLPLTLVDAPTFIRVKGPGALYMSPNSRQRALGELRPNASMFVLLLLIAAVMLTIVVLDKLAEMTVHALVGEL